MMGKLLKYDFRAFFKVFVFVWPAVLVMAGLNRLLTAIPNGEENFAVAMASVMSVSAMVMLLIGVVVFTMIYIVIRYYSGLLRNEGYLMFTLPTQPVKLLLSKLLSSLGVMLISVLVVALGVLIMTAGTDAFEVFSGLLYLLTGYMETSSATILWILAALSVLASMCAQITQIFLAGAVGNLFHRKKFLFAILTYMGINVTLEVISAIWTAMCYASDALRNLPYEVNLILGLVTNLILSGVFFVLTEFILRKHLNLE